MTINIRNKEIEYTHTNVRLIYMLLPFRERKREFIIDLVLKGKNTKKF
jgi:hypothetical protein